MIIDRLQRYLTIAFLSVLLFSQALVFVAVRAASSDSLEAIFIEPVSENLVIGDNIYFQAMLSNEDDGPFDFVAFNLKSFEYGIDDNYQASLQNDGTWKAQSAWHTDLNYQPGTYYLSAVAYTYQDGQLENIYVSDYKIVNLYGQVQASAETAGNGEYISPIEGQVFNFPSPEGVSAYFLDIKFNVDRDLVGDVPLSEYVATINFNVSKYQPGSDMALVDSYTATKIEATAFDQWSAQVDLQDPQKFPAGNYQVFANIHLNSELSVNIDVQNIFNNMDKEVDFQIVRLADVPVSTDSDPTTITITSPSATNPVTGDTLVVMGELDNPLSSSDRQVEMTLTYRGNLGSFDSPGPYILSSLNDADDVLYGTTIVLSDTEPSGDALSIPQFPNGPYTMNFKLKGVNITDINLGSASFELARATTNEQIITLINPQPGQKVTGNNLTLNFTTSFSAADFYYRVINNSTPSIGVEGYIDVISGQTNWTKIISALQHSDLINGYYNISAVAHDNDGQAINFDPIVVYWQINEDVTIEPSLTAYVPSSAQLGADDSVWGSANVLNVSLKLRDTSNNIYTLTHTGVTCSESNILFLNEEVVSGALASGHQYCFYAVLGSGTSLPNGNYRFYLEYTNGSTVVASSERTISYFNAANVEDVPESVFRFLGISSAASIKGSFNLLVASDLDQDSLSVQLKASGTDTILRTFSLPQGSWSDISSLGFNAGAYPNLPFVYIKNNVDSTQWINGTYNLSIAGHESSTINISVDNGDGDDFGDLGNTPGTPGGPVNTNTPGNTNVSSSTGPIVTVTPIDANNIGIQYDATCREWGITDLAECQRFTAVKNSLDESCLRLGLFEPTACEEYIYRTKIDAECQANNIVGQEECRNYLLEKYGSRVDCRLSNTDLCNDVLKNRYLGRLVVGQKLSDSINEVMDPLIGKNISVKELSDNLTARGISSLEVLPLLSSDESKISIVRAQKETVLEEEDKLTILNQAVIILDADGDGLADDLEEYYGTDVNNPDTDGDGYSDGTEINNGYDPAGSGPLVKERTNFDRVVLSGQATIEQPKTSSDKIDGDFIVSAVDRNEANIKLTGKAQSDTWVNLYLYSGLPLVMVTKTDASGNWSYDIKKSLTDGHHKVFVTVNDDTGKIVKQSRPISFLIKEAQAVSVDDYFDESGTNEAVDNFFIYYILGGAFLVFLALGIVVFVHKGKNQNLEI